MDSDNRSFYASFYHTPPLWPGSYDGLEQFLFPYLDLKTFALPAIPHNLRLGHQIEFVFQQLLNRSHHYRVLVHNLAIYQNKISLGEIDYILQNIDNGEHIHIELTYKFYIITGDGQAIDQQLIGPNKRDTFILKKERIKQHQLPLLYRSESGEVLRAYGIDVGKLHQRVCFKSQLFVPFNRPYTDLGPFDPNCIVGSWIFHSDFNTDGFRSYTYYIPSKLEWLLTPNDTVNWKTHGEVSDDIGERIKRHYAPLVWARNGSGGIRKIFILF
ncbi:MAG TPA: DUF1853 family protein [Arenibacter sp.]|nr:DUF1853 family protein [Arenibacter sp.]